MNKMSFYDWCKKDLKDERKINYKFKTHNGELKEFTSDDLVSYDIITRLRASLIDKVELVHDEWNAVIYEE